MNAIIIKDQKHVLKQTNEPRYCPTCSLYAKCHIRRQVCAVFGAPVGCHFEIEE